MNGRTTTALGMTRPAPLRDVAAGVSKWLGMLAALVTSAASWGVITSATADAVTGLLGLIPGVVAAAFTAFAAIRAAVKGEPLVTPVADPMTADGTKLVPSGY